MEHIITKIDEKIWRVSEYGLVNAYVVEGEKYAAVIDTCVGIGDIRKVVTGITDKPIIVLLTHSHPDHNGGVYRFTDCPVYMHKADEFRIDDTDEPIKHAPENAFRKLYVSTRATMRYSDPKIIDELMSLIPEPEPDPMYKWIEIKEGDVIDLGGKLLEVFHTPGHTKGSVCFLDRDSRLLFSGDTANPSIILMRQENNDTKLIKILHDTMKKLWDIRDSYDKMAIGHSDQFAPHELLEVYVKLTQGLLDGTLVGKYEEKGFRKGDVVRDGKVELWYQCDA